MEYVNIKHSSSQQGITTVVYDVEIKDDTVLGQASHKVRTEFHCDYCGKISRHKNDLRKHVRIHTGEKPYKCTICGEGYAQSQQVKKHMIVNHRMSGAELKPEDKTMAP